MSNELNDTDLTLWEALPDIPINDILNIKSKSKNSNTINKNDFREFAMASTRGTLYLCGGMTGQSLIQNSLLSFHMASRKWTKLPPMKYHRWGHRLAVVEGGRYLFAIGGWGFLAADSESSPSKRSIMRGVLRHNPSKVAQETAAPIVEKLTSYEVFDVTKQIWKEAGNLNESRRGFAMAVDSTTGKIYVFGGLGSCGGAISSAEVYNPFENEWDYLEPMPEAKRSCYPVCVGNLIHLFENGKRTITYNTATSVWSEVLPDETHVPKCPAEGRICSTTAFAGGELIIYGYPVKGVEGPIADRWMIAHMTQRRTRAWTVLPPVDAFTYYRTAEADGKLIIAMGNNKLVAFQIVDDMVDDDSTLRTKSTNSSVSGSSCNSSVHSNESKKRCEVIKDDGTWSLQPEFPSKPTDFRGYAVASVGDMVYISGGCSGESTIHRSFLSYNVLSKKWKKLPGMTHRRLGHKMAVSTDGRYLYVLGGGDGKTMRSMGVDIYDILKETWTSAPSMNHYRVFFGFVVISGKIFVFGGIGYDNGKPLSSVEMFDPETSSWEFKAPMPEERGVCYVIKSGDAICLFGTPSQKVLAYDPALDEWLEDVPLKETSLPSCPPGGCVCAASSFLGGEVLVLKYPIEGMQSSHRRTVYIYKEEGKSWLAINLLDEFGCYSAVVAGDKCVIVTPKNQLQACNLSHKHIDTH